MSEPQITTAQVMSDIDAELAALAEIVAALEPLDAKARILIVTYIVSRFHIEIRLEPQP